MDEYLSKALDHTFAALAHPTRRKMLDYLVTSKKSIRVTDLAADFDCALNVASKHIKSLERAGLVKRVKNGRVHELTIAKQPLREANAFITRYTKRWEKQFDRLEAHLDEMAKEDEQS